ncbi:MAG TPA: hypothetical protein VEL79_07980 [Vicinamibacterales bacterium]|nr:hypothetical protein [Vicinamibacterales bacterium]
MPQAESTSAFEVLGVRVDVVQVADGPELFQRFFADPVAAGTRHFLHEPRRLWRRTVLLGPRFVAKSLAELFRESLQDRAL